MNCPFGSGRFSPYRLLSDKPILYGFLQALSSVRITLWRPVLPSWVEMVAAPVEWTSLLK